MALNSRYVTDPPTGGSLGKLWIKPLFVEQWRKLQSSDQASPVSVSIIIVNGHSATQVRRCVGSLWQYCRRAQPEVIVVDDGSFDGCEEMLRREFPSVIFVQSQTNIGRAAANNLGAQRASGTHMLFLHYDTEFIEDSVTVLTNALDALGNAGAVGCQLINPDRTIQTNCVRSFPTLTNQLFDSEYLRERFPELGLWGQQVLHAKWPRQAEVDVVTDTCLMVRRSAFDQLGGFNESFAAYGADTDLCFRFKDSGAPVYYVPSTSVVHRGDGDFSHAIDAVSNVTVRESIFRFMTMNYANGYGYAYRASMAVNAIARLLLIPPMMPLGNVIVRHGRGSWKKWTKILHWSVRG